MVRWLAGSDYFTLDNLAWEHMIVWQTMIVNFAFNKKKSILVSNDKNTGHPMKLKKLLWLFFFFLNIAPFEPWPFWTQISFWKPPSVFIIVLCWIKHTLFSKTIPLQCCTISLQANRWQKEHSHIFLEMNDSTCGSLSIQWMRLYRHITQSVNSPRESLGLKKKCPVHNNVLQSLRSTDAQKEDTVLGWGTGTAGWKGTL